MESERLKDGTNVHLVAEAKEMLKRIKDDFPDNPEAMGYFYEIFQSAYCDEGLVGEIKSPQRRMIGIMCVHVPQELIYASGVKPLRLCSGAYTFERIGADFMPAKSCSLVKAILGMLHMRHDSLNLIVNPTTCDQKKKFGEILREMGYKVYNLELPPTKDTEEARLYWQRSVKNLAITLEDITGQRITKGRLKDAIKRLNKARAEYRRLCNLRKASPSLIFGKDAFLITSAYFFDDIDKWTDALMKLNSELEEKRQKGFCISNKSAPRILLTGSPPIFPNLKLPILVEQAGGVIVIDETCLDRMLYDAVAVDEWHLYDMLPAIADRYLKPCTCPIFVFNDDRKRRLSEMARVFDVDGVVYQAFAGCQPFEMEARSINNALMKEGIPMLYIETDYSPEDLGQLSTRVEAFIESIKAKKRRKQCAILQELI